MPSADTHGDVIAQLTRERAEIIERLSDAMALLAGVAAHLRVDKIYTDLGHQVPASESKNEDLKRVDAFLAGGLFGDKGNAK